MSSKHRQRRKAVQHAGTNGSLPFSAQNVAPLSAVDVGIMQGAVDDKTARQIRKSVNSEDAEDVEQLTMF